jgi:hypothetical protein
MIPPELGMLTKLVKLDLSDNVLTDLPLELEGLVAIRELNLAKNKIGVPNEKRDTLPLVVCKLKTLRNLTIDYNCIGAFPSAFLELDSLAELSFKNSWIAFNADIFMSGPFSLKKLNLFKTSLKDDNWVPLLGLSALEELNLGSCSIGRIPMDINRLSNLRILNLSENDLTYIPTTLMQLSQIKKDTTGYGGGLSLSYNSVCSPPFEMFEWLAIHSDWVCYNQFCEPGTCPGLVTAENYRESAYLQKRTKTGGRETHWYDITGRRALNMQEAKGAESAVGIYIRRNIQTKKGKTSLVILP